MKFVLINDKIVFRLCYHPPTIYRRGNDSTICPCSLQRQWPCFVCFVLRKGRDVTSIYSPHCPHKLCLVVSTVGKIKPGYFGYSFMDLE